MSAFTKGYVVVRDAGEGAAPKPVSRVYHARQAAVDFCELAAKADTKSTFYVTDKVGYDKGKGDIK